MKMNGRRKTRVNSYKLFARKLPNLFAHAANQDPTICQNQVAGSLGILGSLSFRLLLRLLAVLSGVD